jgi:hypothetical protein
VAWRALPLAIALVPIACAFAPKATALSAIACACTPNAIALLVSPPARLSTIERAPKAMLLMPEPP